MLSFVLKHTPLKLCWVPTTPTTTRRPRAAGPADVRWNRSRSTPSKLGADEDGLEPPYGKVPLNMVVMQQDYVRLNQLKRHPRGLLRSLKVGVRSVWANATGKNLVGMGRALIAPLRIGLQKAGRSRPAEHRVDRPVRRGRRRPRHLRPRHERTRIG